MFLKIRKNDWLATLYLALLLGSTLFPDKSCNKVKTRMFSLLLDHQSISCYAWGVAVLADVYRQLGMASRALGNGISGCALLVRVCDASLRVEGAVVVDLGLVPESW